LHGCASAVTAENAGDLDVTSHCDALRTADTAELFQHSLWSSDRRCSPTGQPRCLICVLCGGVTPNATAHWLEGAGMLWAWRCSCSAFGL